jgi:acyl-CoA synthetase (AMP-forming)/AMP-acid ligase II
MTFLALAVRKAARDHGAATALVAGRGPLSLSFQQLNAASEAMAARLAVRGVGQGQVAALLLPASLDYVVAYCALAKVGAVTAGVGAHYSPAERQGMLEQVRPDVVIGTEELLTGRLPDAQIIPVRLAQDRREFAAGLPMLGRERLRTVPSPRSHNGSETIVFTSGTSGLPKGALFGARQIGGGQQRTVRADAVIGRHRPEPCRFHDETRRPPAGRQPAAHPAALARPRGAGPDL